MSFLPALCFSLPLASTNSDPILPIRLLAMDMFASYLALAAFVLPCHSSLPACIRPDRVEFEWKWWVRGVIEGLKILGKTLCLFHSSVSVFIWQSCWFLRQHIPEYSRPRRELPQRNEQGKATKQYILLIQPLLTVNKKKTTERNSWRKRSSCPMPKENVNL